MVDVLPSVTYPAQIYTLNLSRPSSKPPATTQSPSTYPPHTPSPCESDLTLDRCLGRPQPEVVVRLSNGDEGEIQIKNLVLFTHYLSDELATRAVFTEDGYYRTGDLSHRVGDDYIFDGRMGDFIKSNGHRIPIVEVEMHLLRLPLITDACPVTDATNNERVAAILRLQQHLGDDTQTDGVSISIPGPDGSWLGFL
ncbi:hypothetical protein BJX62DRAFT_241847 [Aspergillus germanicus]